MAKNSGNVNRSGIRGKRKKHARRRWARVLLVLLILFAASVLGSLFLSRFGLTTTRFTEADGKLVAPFTVVQLTDVHGSRFGIGNAWLVRKVRRESPDLILITGDLINQDADEAEVRQAEELIKKLRSAAPVYYSLGNHELAHIRNDGTDALIRRFTDAGAEILDCEYRDIEVNGQTIRIGGASGYCKPDLYLHERITKKEAEERAMLKEMQETELFTLLLAHMPYCWIRDGGINEWQLDTVFTGHVHGGQIRFPFLGRKGKDSPGEMRFPYTGGVWGPDHGYFPGALAGLYTAKDGHCRLFLSRGLGSQEKIPRFNNIPEILSVRFTPKQ